MGKGKESPFLTVSHNLNTFKSASGLLNSSKKSSPTRAILGESSGGNLSFFSFFTAFFFSVAKTSFYM